MSESRTIAVLEWGTSKIKVLLAELVDGKKMNIISKSSADTCMAIKKGDIMDVAKTYNKTRDAITSAENNCPANIKSVKVAANAKLNFAIFIFG